MKSDSASTADIKKDSSYTDSSVAVLLTDSQEKAAGLVHPEKPSSDLPVITQNALDIVQKVLSNFKSEPVSIAADGKKDSFDTHSVEDLLTGSQEKAAALISSEKPSSDLNDLTNQVVGVTGDVIKQLPSSDTGDGIDDKEEEEGKREEKEVIDNTSVVTDLLSQSITNAKKIIPNQAAKIRSYRK